MQKNRGTIVIVHGAWVGGWRWRQVADDLQARGHRVFTPTLTGLGERVHLTSPAVNLSVRAVDIANLLSRGLLWAKEMPSGRVYSLTPAGRELTSRVTVELQSLEAHALSAFTAGEVAILKQCLRALIAATTAGANRAAENGTTGGRS